MRQEAQKAKKTCPVGQTSAGGGGLRGTRQDRSTARPRPTQGRPRKIRIRRLGVPAIVGIYKGRNGDGLNLPADLDRIPSDP